LWQAPTITHLREELLGGVSRDLLDHMTALVLMSH
jgi:hypothetical protein